MLCWPIGLRSKGRHASSRRYNNDSTELEAKTAALATLGSSHLWINRQRREFLCWPGWLTLTIMWTLDYESTMQVGKGMSGIQESPSLGHRLVLPCPGINTNGKPQQPNPSRTKNGLDPSGMTVWDMVTTSGKGTVTSWAACWRQKEYRIGSGRRVAINASYDDATETRTVTATSVSSLFCYDLCVCNNPTTKVCSFSSISSWCPFPITPFPIITFAHTNILFSNDFTFLHFIFKQNHKLMAKGHPSLSSPPSQDPRVREEQLFLTIYDFFEEIHRSPPLMMSLTELQHSPWIVPLKGSLNHNTALQVP